MSDSWQLGKMVYLMIEMHNLFFTGDPVRWFQNNWLQIDAETCTSDELQKP